MVDIDDSIIEIHRYGEEGSVRTTRVNGIWRQDGARLRRTPTVNSSFGTLASENSCSV